MEFCKQCDNMLYTKVLNEDEKSKLVYYCLNCNVNYDNLKKDDNCIYEVNFNIDNIRRESCINKYTTEDPTLPRAQGIKCPNETCPSANPEIVYINYDPTKMKYTYICLDCKKAGSKSYVW
tara:strand:+ start:50 stop:412 length:363 start_codon:yes stop_codon:yes gene_type:complete